jgi:hypothetical protein
MADIVNYRDDLDMSMLDEIVTFKKLKIHKCLGMMILACLQT